MIAILMATHNGEKYIVQQIESLLSQSFQDFILYVHDDCSTDGTSAILKDFAARYPERIVVHFNEENSGGAKHNFFNMMSHIKDDYVMLCDQDDVWLPDKIAKTIQKIREIESRFGKHIPALVHTDLCVVDVKLNIINLSFVQSMNANYNRTSLKDQVIQNTLTGCTVIYNRALADLIGEKPNYMVMHDWWLMLIASAFGEISHIEDRPILYRQHCKNQIGAKNVRTLRYKLDRLMHGYEVREAINATYRQAESFLKAYANMLTQDQSVFLEKYVSIPRRNKLMRWVSVLRLGVHKSGISRNVAYFLFL